MPLSIHIYNNSHRLLSLLQNQVLKEEFLFRKIIICHGPSFTEGKQEWLLQLNAGRSLLQQELIQRWTRQYRKLHQWMQAEQEIAGAAPDLLFEILHQPWFGHSSETIATASIEAAAKRPSPGFVTHIRNEFQAARLTLFQEENGYAALHHTIDKLYILLELKGTMSETGFIDKMLQLLGIEDYLKSYFPEADLPSVLSAVKTSHLPHQQAPFPHFHSLHFITGAAKPNEEEDLRIWIPESIKLLSELIETVSSFTETCTGINVLLLAPEAHIPAIEIKNILSRYPAWIPEWMPSSISFSDPLLNRKARPILSPLPGARVNNILASLKINASNLNNYIDCPLRFYFQNIIRMPNGRNSAASFGIAVHEALEKLFRQARDQQGIFAPATQLIQWFEDAMNELKVYFSPSEFEQKRKYGQILLPQYYKHHLAGATHISTVERALSGVLPDGTPVNGKLDKIEYRHGSITVVDYKTGRYERAINQLQAPSYLFPAGGAYWRQAAFYRMLIRHSEFEKWPFDQIIFSFVEPVPEKGFTEKKVIISEEQLEGITGLAARIYKEIQDKQFYTGCGRETCRWCLFARDHYMAAAYTQAPMAQVDLT